MTPQKHSWLSDVVRLIVGLDEEASRRICLPKPADRWPLSYLLANVGAHLGDSLLWAGITGLLWWRRKEAGERRLLMGWLGSFVLSLLATLTLKRLFRRPRPGVGRMLYGPGADQHSFPSGHGARAGVILVWASVLMGRWRWLSPLMALWIGWSRVALGIHYVGDVLVGLILGLLSAGFVRRRVSLRGVKRGSS